MLNKIKIAIKTVPFIHRAFIFVYEILYKLIRAVRIFFANISRPFIRQPNVLSIKSTIDYILENKCSVARYGDGEMKLIMGLSIRFQQADTSLAQELEQILYTRSDTKFIVCIPDTFSSLRKYERKARKYWENFMLDNRKNWNKRLNKTSLYGNAFISRPYMMFRNKSDAAQNIAGIKQIWRDRDVLIVEGEMSRLGVGNDLFNNVKSIKRILLPNRNAWQYRTEIIDACQVFKTNTLVLLSLGPTATVLAYDLSKLGYQAVDIGHIDTELEWFRVKAQTKIPIKGKFVNEAQGDSDITPCDDSDYNNSIVLRINC